MTYCGQNHWVTYSFKTIILRLNIPRSMLQSLNKLLSFRFPFSEANYYQYQVQIISRTNSIKARMLFSKFVDSLNYFANFLQINTIFKLPNRAGIWNLPLLSIGPVHFRFKGWWVVFFVFITFVIDLSASKQWGPRSDAAFCGI